MTTPIKIKEVCKEELDEIVQRREKIGLSAEDVSNNLVGLCLSGGALRSASFCLGLVQSLQLLGLWKFVDYLSTVSGGGYIGAYLTSSTLRDKRPISKGNQPLNRDSASGQPARVQRFIYGGNYLFRPLRLANKYLMGVFFINVAIGSGLVTVCALFAFLWRCLDYPAIRDRAEIFGLGDDLAAPFWPFWFFGIAWLMAWVVSLFRRGSDARGVVARYLLATTIGSLLIGFGLLAGNGDIADLDKYLTGDMKSLGGVWGPLAALVIGCLLPFLSPKRLLQSGMQPSKPWERYVFAIASTALLVGLPLLLVGLLARENISGYNNDPHRPLVRSDITDWTALCELVSVTPAKKDAATGNDELPRNGEATTFATMVQTAVREACQRAIAAPRPKDVSDYLEEARKVEKPDASSVENRTMPDDEKSQTQSAIDSKVDPTYADMIAESPFDKLAKTEDFLLALRKTRGERSEQEQALVDLYLGNYLKFTADKLRSNQLYTLRDNRAKLLDEGEWNRWHFKRYALRCFSMLEGTFEPKGNAYEYWKSKLAVEQSEGEFCVALNELLANKEFLSSRLPKEKNGAIASSISKESLNNRLPKEKNDTIASSIAKILSSGLPKEKNDAIASSIGEASGEHTKDINRLLASAALPGVGRWPDHQVVELNRRLLEYEFGNIFRKRDEIRRTVTIYEDQIARLKWFFGALSVFLVAGMWVDLNALSLHRYYRNCLAQAYIVPRNSKTPSIALSEMDTTEFGGPYHLITGSVGMIRKRICLGKVDDHHALRDSDEKIDQRWVDNFLFSRLYCGSELTDYVETAAYENSVPGYTHKIDLAEATAISGAALSPQHVSNWLLAFLMVAMNLSLGQYVPNPRAGRPRLRPRVLAILLSLWKKAEDRPYCFVSDGGHCENLGLVQLLKRRCKLIIAVDVSCDPEHRFHDLARAIRIERVHAGIRLVALDEDENGEEQEFSTDDLRLRDKDEDDIKQGNCKKHYFLARIKYPDAEDGLLVYIKPSFDGDESPDLVQFRHQEKEFPHDSTSDQLFDEAKVEAYRALGYHIGMQLRYRLPPEIRVGELWDYGAKVDANQLCEWFETADSLRSPERRVPIVDHPAAASEKTLEGIRPIYQKLVQQMRAKAKEPADIHSGLFVEIVNEDDDLRGFGMPTAVAAIQCAVVDPKLTSATDREYCVWLLQSLEQDENVATNLPESLDVLLQAAAEGNPDRVRLAAIATLAILGRGGTHRARVKKALTEFHDTKASIRLAVKNALSNFKDSPRKAR